MIREQPSNIERPTPDGIWGDCGSRQLNRRLIETSYNRRSLANLQLVEARFFVENAFSFVEDRSRFLGRVADGG
jgi:hypothetical protein